MRKTIQLLSALLLTFIANLSFAVVCTSDGRTADLTISTACLSGGGNPHTSDINALFGDTPSWNLLSDIAGIEGTSGSLSSGDFSVTLNDGSYWGSTDIEGTWEIDSDFWTQYDEAVISMHVGGTHRDDTDDFFAWSILSGSTSGTFEYNQSYGNGGGLSNLMLWGRNTGNVTVSEPGNLALLTFGLLGLLVSRKLTHSK